MHSGRFVFAQLMQHLPLHTFRRLVRKFDADRRVRRLSCLDQFLIMAFAQLTFRESLRDIETCLRAHDTKRFHLGIRSPVARSTLADANESRDWRLFADFGHALIRIARSLYANEPGALDLAEVVYALDATTIDLSLSVFPWARSPRVGHAHLKLHTLLDLRGCIPAFIHITDGTVYDVKTLDLLVPEPGAFYLMDRGYIDFLRLRRIHEHGAFFVMRAKKNLCARRRYSAATDRRSGVCCDQTVVLTLDKSVRVYPHALRRIRVHDAEKDRSLTFLTNHFGLPAVTIAELYRQRWQVELFFKWIKQHLRIKAFFGTSANAVKAQIWIAVSVYVLVAIVRKRLRLDASLHELLQILSLTLFEKTPISMLFQRSKSPLRTSDVANQLILL